MCLRLLSQGLPAYHQLFPLSVFIQLSLRRFQTAFKTEPILGIIIAFCQKLVPKTFARFDLLNSYLQALLDYVFFHPSQGQDNRGSINGSHQFVGFIYARERLIGFCHHGNEIHDRRIRWN
jgi:hypothetical protein